MRCSRLSVRRSAGQLGLGDLLVGAQRPLVICMGSPTTGIRGGWRRPWLSTPQPPTARKARHKVLAIQKWAILGNAMIRTATPPVVATAHPYQPTILARRAPAPYRRHLGTLVPAPGSRLGGADPAPEFLYDELAGLAALLPSAPACAGVGCCTTMPSCTTVGTGLRASHGLEGRRRERKATVSRDSPSVGTQRRRVLTVPTWPGT